MKTPTNIIIDKLGYYRTHGQGIARVTSLEEPTYTTYQVRGTIENHSKHVSWTTEGRYNSSWSGHDLDLIEYLRPELYPELYI